jgi:hypothetical protein
MDMLEPVMPTRTRMVDAAKFARKRYAQEYLWQPSPDYEAIQAVFAGLKLAS